MENYQGVHVENLLEDFLENYGIIKVENLSKHIS